ncbi:Lacal_2735 family protein [Mesonia phycicola]|nr:Lacal_2735 family protein [Mesonia phycicola]
MQSWKNNKDKIDSLRKKYTKLMKRAYEVAPKNKSKSDDLNHQARLILQELKRTELNFLH